jgi:protein associated with RNAse G/E
VVVVKKLKTKVSKRTVSLIWFLASVLFFLTAMLRDEGRAVFITLGVVALIFSGTLNRKKDSG